MSGQPSERGSSARPGPSGEEGIQLCSFIVGPDPYLIDIRRVEEILEPMAVTPLPGAPAFVEGVVTLRGAIMPVVDVRKRLGSAPSTPRARWRLLVVLIGRRRVGLLVDAVKEVVRVELSDLKPAPPLLGQGSPFVLGVCSVAAGSGHGGLQLLLDVKALLEVSAAEGRR